MSIVICVFLLACSVLFIGCHEESQLPEGMAPEKEACRMIKIDNLTVTEESLTLDYHVSNPFAYDIWVCEDVDVKSKYDVETRIDGGTVWIRLRFHLESNIFRSPVPMAKYLPLARGELRSRRILLNLPVRNASPVYIFDEDHKERKQVILHRAVFEVGYFEGEFMDRVSEGIEKIKRAMDPGKATIEPLIVEEIQDGQKYQILYPTYLWSGLSREKSAKVVVTDVDIPCSVVVDDE